MIIHRPGLPTLYVDEPAPESPSPPKTPPLPSVAQAMAAAAARHALAVPAKELIPIVPQKPLIENTKAPT